MANKVVETIYRIRDEVSSTLKRIGQAWRGTKTDADKASDAVDASTKRMSSAFGRVTSGVSGLRAAIGTLAAVVGLQKLKDGLLGILNTGERFDDLRKQLSTAFGGVDQGSAAFEKLQAFAKTVPNGFEDIAQAAIALRQRGLDPLDGTLQALIDNNAALDGSQQDLLKTIDALGKANLRGEVGLRALVQLSQQGVPVFDLLGQSMGKSAAEVRKLAEDGKLGADTVRLIVQELGKLRAGAAASEMGDLDAQFRKLKDSGNAFLAQIADAGALEFFQGRLKALGEEVARLAANGQLAAFAKKVSDGIVSVAKAIEGSVSLIARYSGLLVELGKAYLAVKFATFVAGMASSAKAMYDAATAAKAAAGAAGGLKGALAAIPASVKIAVAAIGLELAISQWTLLAQRIKEAGEIEDEASALAIKAAERRAAIAGKIESILTLYAEYRRTLIKSNDEVATATEVELTSYRKRLEAAQQFFSALAAQKRRSEDTKGAKLAEAQALAYGEAIAAVTRQMGLLAAAKDKALAVPGVSKLQESMLALGVSAQQAGIKITEEGGKAIAFFKTVAAEATATSAQIRASFAAGLGLAKTTAEVQAFEVALKAAYDAGKISAAEYGVEAGRAAAKTLEIKGALNQVAGSFPLLEAAMKQAREGFGEVAQSAAQVADSTEQVAEAASAAGTAVGGVLGPLVAMYQKFSAVSPLAAEFFKNSYNSSVRLSHSLGDVVEAIARAEVATDRAIGAQLTQAKDLERQLEAVGQAGIEAGYANAQAAKLGEDGMRAFAEQVRQGHAGFALLNQADLDQLSEAASRAADKVAEIGERAKQAKAELEALNRELQNEADQRAGNDTAIAEREHQERLANIERLARAGGAAAQAAANQARDLARRNHEARLAEIAAEAAARARAAEEERRREQDRTPPPAPRWPGSTGGGPVTPGPVGSGGLGVVNNFNFAGVGTMTDAQVRELLRRQQQIEGRRG